jgi:cytochrome c oxidase assembly protein subunit 11
MSAPPKQNHGNDANKKVIIQLMFVVVGMFGFGFALVPLYDVFCDLTGLNGKTGGQVVMPAEMKVDSSREITVEFMASLNETMPWSFYPDVKSVQVHPGQPMKISYYVKNDTNNEIVGQAIPSLAPGLAAPYFHKTECFCFTEQILKAGEEKHMPVVFFIDPTIPKDVNVLTLSYTFFIKPGSEAAASLTDNSKHQDL